MHTEAGRRDQMHADRTLVGAGADTGHCAAGHHGEFGIGADRPFSEHHKDEQCRRTDGAHGAPVRQAMTNVAATSSENTIIAASA
jgi:hypothetical protein